MNNAIIWLAGCLLGSFVLGIARRRPSMGEIVAVIAWPIALPLLSIATVFFGAMMLGARVRKAFSNSQVNQ